MLKFIKIIPALLCVVCMGASFASCSLKSRIEDWFKNESEIDSSLSDNPSTSENSNGSENEIMLIGNGEIYHDEYVEITPSKANVQVEDTFKINVEVTGNGTATFSQISSSDKNVISVDESGNVTALNVGTGYVSVGTAYGDYLVEINVTEETGETDDTYVYSGKFKRGDRIITISHYMVKMHVGDTFTFEFTSTTTDTPTVTVEPISGNEAYVSIDGHTVTALKAGENIEVYLDFVEDNVPFLAYITIIE